MIPVAANVRIWIATGHTDMRKGMQGLALLVQEGLGRDPFAGDVFVFRGRGVADQGAVARWNWIVAVRQAAGPWTFCLAGDGGRCGGAGATRNTRGGHRARDRLKKCSEVQKKVASNR
jgi:hypothetical protein